MKRSEIKRNPEAIAAWRQRSRKPLPRRSQKATHNQSELSKIKREMIAINPNCRRCRSSLATELHHRSGRVGYLATFQPLLVPLCAPCHALCKAEPAMMMETGWIVSRHVDYRMVEIPELKVL